MNRWRMVGGILAMIFLFACCGLYRDAFFRHLNAQISVLEYGTDSFEFQFGLQFMGNMSLAALLKLKWIATLGFSLVFFGISCLGIRIWFHRREHYFWLILIYAAAIVLSALAMLVGKISGMQEQWYYFARWMMGAAQSPVLFLIVAALLLSPLAKSTSTTQTPE